MSEESMTADKRGNWDLFISYSVEDAPLVSRLAEKLRGAGIRLWMPQFQDSQSTDWAHAIQNAVAQSKACLVFVPSDAYWAQLLSAEWLEIQRNVWARPDFTVIPVQTEKDVSVPAFLRRFEVLVATDQDPPSEGELKRLMLGIVDRLEGVSPNENFAGIVQNKIEASDRFDALRKLIASEDADPDHEHE